MLENDEILTKNTIIGQANIISELTEQLKGTQAELKEIKDIRRKAESKNTTLLNTLKKIDLVINTQDSLNLSLMSQEIKSILDEATKQL